MTRGRTANVLHVVAVDEQDAREQFIDAFARDSADRGLDEARKQVERDMHGIIAGNAATVAAEVDQLIHDAAKADRQTAVWDDAASQFARLRERATQAQQEARSAGRFSRRRAERDTQTATSEWEQARDRATQRWGSAPWGAGEVESWAERVSQQRAGQDPQVRDASKASTVAKIELNTAHKRHPLEAQGLARRVFRNDPAAQFLTAESGERRAAQNTERWRGRATDLRAEAVELRQLPTDQAAERVQAKHQPQLSTRHAKSSSHANAPNDSASKTPIAHQPSTSQAHRAARVLDCKNPYFQGRCNVLCRSDI